MIKNKRFHHKEDDWEIFDGEKHLAYAHSGFQAEKICELLNELAEENQELKLFLCEIEHELTFLTGLTATDSTNLVKEDMEKYLFRLDYTKLLKKIDKVMCE